jgi:hypothetical protein
MQKILVNHGAYFYAGAALFGSVSRKKDLEAQQCITLLMNPLMT